jgi:hypothetical protein
VRAPARFGSNISPQTVVVTKDRLLIAGRRRLEACKRLGWADVPVTTVDLREVVRGEYAENSERENFLPSEVDAIRLAMLPFEQAAAKERIETGRPPQGKFPEGETGRVRDKIGAFAGLSGRTVEKIAVVCEAAKADPEKFGEIAETMDKTRNVNGAFRAVKKAKDEKRILELVPIVGKFKTLIIDPPWDYEGLSLAARAAPDDATMTQEQLLAMPVPGWAEENCHLYLWTTNNFLPRAVELMAAWGFQHKTVLTWVRPAMTAAKCDKMKGFMPLLPSPSAVER